MKKQTQYEKESLSTTTSVIILTVIILLAMLADNF
jgi:hypothetical protein